MKSDQMTNVQSLRHGISAALNMRQMFIDAGMWCLFSCEYETTPTVRLVTEHKIYNFNPDGSFTETSDMSVLVNIENG